MNRWLVGIIGLCAWMGLAACAAPSATLPALSTLAPTIPPTTPPTTTARPAVTFRSSPTPPPLNNRTPEPTATPAPVLRALTEPGCCAGPFWSPDGAQVWYIDRPSADQPSGIWGVAVSGGAPQFISDRLGLRSPDGALLAYPEAGKTIVERLASGEKWAVPAAGRAISFSPDSRRIAWQAASSAVNFDRRRVEVWVADVDGQHARLLARLIGGGLSGWFPDSANVLVSGRASAEAAPGLARLSVADGASTAVLQGVDLRGASISPDGHWLAYQVAFSGDPQQDGLWVANVDGGPPRRLPVFGAYRWRAEGRLLVIPLELNLGSQRVVEFEADTGALMDLTDPRLTSFRVVGGDWALSPDGRRIVFVNAQDHALWLLELSPE